MGILILLILFRLRYEVDGELLSVAVVEVPLQ